MNKANLKEKWGTYCNTDNLVDDMMCLLRRHGHTNSEHGICTVLDTYFTNKEPLIKLIASSKNYNGNLRIVTKQPFDRKPDSIEIRNFFSKCRKEDWFNAKKLLQYTDSKGKTIFDYLMTGKKQMSINDLPKSDAQQDKIRSYDHFNPYSQATKKSTDAHDIFHDWMAEFSKIYDSKLQRDLRMSDLVLKAGTKTSRAFNKVCVNYGIDKFDSYNKIFAKYADLVSELTREMYFVISVNPLDYLTMSVGINWQSCHHIQYGSYKQGCMSYMLDSTSMITFVVENVEGPIHEIPKVYLQMFHYNNNYLFMQNRLYPQANDGATDLYSKFRGLVTDEFADLLKVENNWSTSNVAGNRVVSVGSHYCDYYYNASCKMFAPTLKYSALSSGEMTIGHTGICVNCGKEISRAGGFSHSNRMDCM